MDLFYAPTESLNLNAVRFIYKEARIMIKYHNVSNIEKLYTNSFCCLFVILKAHAWQCVIINNNNCACRFIRVVMLLLDRE